MAGGVILPSDTPAASRTPTTPSAPARDIPVSTVNTTFREDAKYIANFLVQAFKDKVGLDSPEQRLYNHRLGIAAEFVKKYEDSLQNGTKLKPADVKDVQTLYFEGHLTGGTTAQAQIMNKAREGVDAVIEKPAQFGLKATGGVSATDYLNGVRGWAFVEDGAKASPSATAGLAVR